MEQFSHAILWVRVKSIAVILVLMLFAWAGWSAQTGAQTPSPKKTVSSNAPKKTPPAKNTTISKKQVPTNAPKKSAAPAKKMAGSGTKAKSNAPVKSSTKNRQGSRPAPRRYTQNEPTPDRYREIQSALIERGYLKSDATGKWDSTTVDAMKRFQQDQSLEASGKLDPLTLIALGLGPKRTASAQARP